MDLFWLNTWNEKKATIRHDKKRGKIVQIWKKNVFLGDFSLTEFRELLCETLAKNISKHLNEGEENECHCAYDRTSSHIIQYVQSRDKRFVLVERDDEFYESENGLPEFQQTFFGATSWGALCAQSDMMLSALEGGSSAPPSDQSDSWGGEGPPSV